VTLYKEIDWRSRPGGQIIAIRPNSLADELKLEVGDVLLAVNDQAVNDVIDVQFYSAEEDLEILIRRDDELLLFEAVRQYDQPFGLEFAHPTFDVDIRRCNNLCGFCFVLQMPGKFRRTLYIKDDDYRYSFLFGHYVTLTNLSEHDWWRIEHMRLSPLYVSVHVTDLEMRRRFLRNDSAPDIIDQLRWLAERGLSVHTQLVIVPDFNDGELLERSISELAALWPAVKSISVVPVGLTQHHKYGMRSHTPTEALEMLGLVEKHQSSFLDHLGQRFVYATDEWYLVAGREVPPLAAYDGQQLQENGLGLVRLFLDEWSQLIEEIENHSHAPLIYKKLALITGTLFAPALEPVARNFAKRTGCQIEVISVVNRRLGESITAAGLLMAEDIIQQRGRFESAELVILPRVVFDHPDLISLDNISPQNIAELLDRPVALADVMGDVWDACTGRSSVVFRPDSNGSE
jgi:putative radical SAM enzyme (TIGR03279 family)